MNEHWRPYLSTCSYCDISYTVITKMENVDRDRKILLEMVGAGALLKEIAHANQSAGESIQNVTIKYFRQLPMELGKKLMTIYGPDLEMFDYDPSIYLDL